MRLTYTQEADFRQQRDFGQKITASFEFISQHWRGLGRALLYIVLPLVLVHGIVSGFLQADALERARQLPAGNDGLLAQLARLGQVTQAPLYWLNVVLSAAMIVALMLTIYGYMLHCLRLPAPTAEVSVGAVWAVVKARFGKAFLSYFGIISLTMLGFLFFAIPGIYLCVPLSLFFVVLVLEGTGFRAGISRAMSLSKGKWWSTFGLVMVMFLMLAVGFGVIGGFMGVAFKSLGMQGSPDGYSVVSIVMALLGGLLSLLIYPPMLIALAFQYFNLVERKEGVGLRSLVDQLGRAPVPVPHTALRPDEEGEY